MSIATNSPQQIIEHSLAWWRYFPGSPTKDELEFLVESIIEKKPKLMLELGVAAGCSTVCILKTLSQLENVSILHSVDSLDYYYKDDSKPVGFLVDAIDPDLKNNWILHVQNSSLDISNILNDQEKIDYLFIDAGHSHPWASIDLLAVLPFLEDDAIVCFHDINLPLVYPHIQEWGPKWLFDELRCWKRVQVPSDGFLHSNIGLIKIDDKDSIEESIKKVIHSKPWQTIIDDEHLKRLRVSAPNKIPTKEIAAPSIVLDEHKGVITTYQNEPRRCFDRIYSGHSRKESLSEVNLFKIENLNKWSQSKVDLFECPFFLHPNESLRNRLRVSLSLEFLPEEIDSISCIFKAASKKCPPVFLAIGVFDDNGIGQSRGEHLILDTENHNLVLTFDRDPTSLTLFLEVYLDEAVDSAMYSRIDILSLLAYKGNDLLSLCDKFESDRGTTVMKESSCPRAYSVIYDDLLSVFRDQEFNMLEIGFDASDVSCKTSEHSKIVDNQPGPRRAQSFKVWPSYFPMAKTYGFSINDSDPSDQELVVIGRGDQSSRNDWDTFLKKNDYPRFKLIIDNGSRAASHQQIALAYLFPYLENGGIYIIEDINWHPFPGLPTTISVLEDFKKTGKVESSYILAKERSYLESVIDTIQIVLPNEHAFAIVSKRP